MVLHYKKNTKKEKKKQKQNQKQNKKTNNLNFLYPIIVCAKFGWNWQSGSVEEVENVKYLQTDRQTE